MGFQKLRIILISEESGTSRAPRKMFDNAINFFTKTIPQIYYHYFSTHNPPCRGGLDGLVKTLTTKGLYILTTQVFLKLGFPLIEFLLPGKQVNPGMGWLLEF